MLNDIKKKLAAAKFDISTDIQQQFVAYLELLIKWNKAYNLTSIRSPQEMITKHLLDSLSIQKYLHGNTILDVGTGAGLPGIPLALVEPDKKFVLLDSAGKKTIFLTQVVRTLNLSNVTVVNDRVEKYKPAFCFDSILSRAFSSLKQFIEYTSHLCCADGQFLAMKGELPQDEINALGSEYSPIVYDLQIEGLDAKRHLIVINNCARSSAG